MILPTEPGLEQWVEIGKECWPGGPDFASLRYGGPKF